MWRLLRLPLNVLPKEVAFNCGEEIDGNGGGGKPVVSIGLSSQQVRRLPAPRSIAFWDL